MGKLKIRVSYCDAWGGKSKFRSFEQELAAKFADKIEVIENIVHDSSMFEVEIVGGKLLHSKKNGQGFPASRMDEIVQGIKEALAAWSGSLSFSTVALLSLVFLQRKSSGRCLTSELQLVRRRFLNL